MTQLVLVAASAVLALGAVVGSRPLAANGRLVRWTSAAVLWAGGVYVTVMAVGLLGLLNASTLFGVALLVAVLLGVVGLTKRARASATEPPSGWRTRWPSGSRAEHILVASALLLAVAHYGWRVWLALRFPIIAWDDLTYHVAKVDVWLQDGRIGNVTQVGIFQGFPANGEVFTTWLMAFGRNDRLADLTGVLFVPMLVLGTALLARRLGARPWTALFVGLCVVSVPAVFLGSSSAYVDVAVAALTVAALGLTLAAAQGSSRRTAGGLGYSGWQIWVVAGVAAGLAAGAKASALLVIGIVVISLLSWAVAGTRATGRARVAGSRPLAAVGTYAVIVVGFGGFWYIVNLVLHGNPLFPFAIGPFEGPHTRSFIEDVNLAGWFERLEHGARVIASWAADLGNHATYAHDIRPGGFGAAWLLLGVPSVLVLVAVLLRRRQILELLIVVVAALAAWIATPANWWARLTLTLVAVGYAAFGVIMSLPSLTERGFGAARRGIESAGADSPSPSVALATLGLALMLALSVASGVRAVRFANYDYSDEWGRTAATALSLRGVVELSLRGTSELTASVRPWSDCPEITSLPAGSAIATDGSVFPHVAVGPDLERRLVGLVGSHGTVAGLLEELDELSADYLIVDRTSANAALASSVPGSLRVIADEVCGVGPITTTIYELSDPA